MVAPVMDRLRRGTVKSARLDHGWKTPNGTVSHNNFDPIRATHYTVGLSGRYRAMPGKNI